MPNRAPKVVQAWLDTPTTGTIELARDWHATGMPALGIEGLDENIALAPVGDAMLARTYGYFLSPNGFICFVFFLSEHTELDRDFEKVYLAGDFNGWQYAVGKSEWEMYPATLDGELALVWCGRADPFLASSGQRFKFVSGDNLWMDVPHNAPNVVRDDLGNFNRCVNPERTGRHLFSFSLNSPLDLSKPWRVAWKNGKGEGAPLRPDGFFFHLRSSLELGALARENETTFRLFAPRAAKVEVCVCASLEQMASPHRYPLIRRAETAGTKSSSLVSMTQALQEKEEHEAIPGWQGVWEVILDRNLHGWFYWYQIEGPSDCFGNFSKNQKVLDPYALACAGREGPGIILDRGSIEPASRAFKTPDWQNLVIAEVHLRDLLQKAPIDLSRKERLEFGGLAKWVSSPDFYLRKLGVNCVELQPIHEADAQSKEEYHWGYMTTNWFAPCSHYASNPTDGSAIQEFRDLVEAFHKQGMAVIIDVVYNHQGNPAHLMFVDKLYYFTCDKEGHLSNWSGCGNDFRADAAMARRLIIDSCVHLLETFGVDGFRFDLAELLGTPVLKEIEIALKSVKHDVVLIAEPWSYRGHIAGELGDTGWSSWNDGYRNFIRDYVRGGGSSSQLEYFLKGSPWYFAHFPAQTVNYTESHDDRTWIDLITENGDGSGYHPTALDRRRTHLMAATLFCSLGIPMIAAGQDFLRSKHGVNNTYLRGDLNALEYRRIHRFPGSHTYFADWIALRLGEKGRLLRQWSCPKGEYFKSFSKEGSPALVLLYNADSSQGPEKLLFAINASGADVALVLGQDIAELPWVQIANHEVVKVDGVHGYALPVTPVLELPAMTCFLWGC